MNKRTFLIADRIAFVIVPIILSIAYTNGNDHLYKERGSLSLNLLYVILFVKPIIVILGYKWLNQLIPYRRQLGMISFRLALFHTIGLIIAKNLWNISAYLTNPRSNYLFIWSIAMIGMLILALTSNFWSIKFFGKNWKKIQRLAYPTLFLGKLHGDLSHGMGRNISTVTTSTVSVVKYMPTLLLLIIFLWLKYRQYKVQTRQWRNIRELLA